MVLFTLFFCKRLFNICLKITCTSVSDKRLLELVSGRDASTLMRSSRGEWRHAWHISVHGMVDEKEIKSQTFRGGTFLRHRFRFGMYLIMDDMVNSEIRHRIQWSLKINLLKVCNNWIMHMYNPFFSHGPNWEDQQDFTFPESLTINTAIGAKEVLRNILRRWIFTKRERKFKFCGRSGLRGNARIFLVGKRRHHHSNYSTSNSLKMRGRRKKKKTSWKWQHLSFSAWL